MVFALVLKYMRLQGRETVLSQPNPPTLSPDPPVGFLSKKDQFKIKLQFINTLVLNLQVLLAWHVENSCVNLVQPGVT